MMELVGRLFWFLAINLICYTTGKVVITLLSLGFLRSNFRHDGDALAVDLEAQGDHTAIQVSGFSTWPSYVRNGQRYVNSGLVTLLGFCVWLALLWGLVVQVLGLIAWLVGR